MLNGVKIRGEEWDVDWRCVSDDPTTNSLEFEWSFYNDDAPKNITDTEEESIHEQLAEIYFDSPSGPDDE